MKTVPGAARRGRLAARVRILGAIAAIALTGAPGAACGRSPAAAAPFSPVVLRLALIGPGRVAVIELDHFETRKACAASRDALFAELVKTKGELATPDGLRWTVLGARCTIPGTAA